MQQSTLFSRKGSLNSKTPRHCVSHTDISSLRMSNVTEDSQSFHLYEGGLFQLPTKGFLHTNTTHLQPASSAHSHNSSQHSEHLYLPNRVGLPLLSPWLTPPFSLIFPLPVTAYDLHISSTSLSTSTAASSSAYAYTHQMQTSSLLPQPNYYKLVKCSYILSCNLPLQLLLTTIEKQ